jgi:PAS domain S-box-containing protein
VSAPRPAPPAPGRRLPDLRHGAALALAVGLAVAGLALAWLVSPFLDTYTVLPSVTAVLLASWYGGRWPGLLAMAVSLLGIDLLFVQPALTVGMPTVSDIVRLTFFSLLSIGAAWASGRLRRSARALRASEAHTRQLTEEVREYAIVALDPAGRIARWNRGAELIVGYTPDEVLGRDYTLLFPPEAVAAGAPQRELARAASEGRVEDEGWRLCEDGRRFWANVVLTAVHNARGELVGFSLIARDLTERRRAEEALRQANRELAATTYAIAHDLRSPLRALDGYGYLLAAGHGAGLDDEGRELLDRIRSTSRRMGELLDGLLSLARVGREPLRRDEVDLSALAARELDELRASEPGRRVEVALPPALPARGDPRLLGTVMQNLIGNAWKFTAGRNPAHLAVGEVQIESGERAFFVRDDGVGFAPEHAAQLFRPFHRLHRADEFPGHGIGLATVERIVARHGGRVWAEGRPGAGATLYFTLPAASGTRLVGWDTDAEHEEAAQ